jgi:hypothetical protein
MFLGLDVAMHDLLAVSVRQSVGHFPRDLERLNQWKLPLALQPVPERFPLDIRHYVVQQTVGLARVEEGQDMRVIEAGRDFDLASEPIAADGIGELGMEHLERHRTPVP